MAPDRFSFSAVIFDLDGVITDTSEYHYLAWKRLADELGIGFGREDNDRLRGVSRMRSLEIIFEVGNREMPEKAEAERLAAKKNEWYKEYLSGMSPNDLLPGARRVIETVRAAGVKTALGSASKNAPTVLKRLKITDLFDATVDGNDVGRAKPDPEVFLLGARKLGVEPSLCVVAEDAGAGIEAAIRARMFPLGIGTADGVEKAELIVPSLGDLELPELESRYRAWRGGRS